MIFTMNTSANVKKNRNRRRKVGGGNNVSFTEDDYPPLNGTEVKSGAMTPWKRPEESTDDKSEYTKARERFNGTKPTGAIRKLSFPAKALPEIAGLRRNDHVITIYDMAELGLKELESYI